MSKDRKKVLHIHSNVNDKQPTPATLELGELGVNYASGNAFISTKNSNGEVVRFSEDGTIVNWMEYKEVFPYEAYVRGSNSSRTGVTEQDLVNNTSNIIFKLNQVVPMNTVYDEKVNGAKDKYNNLINPRDGDKDGAGFYVDMSQYAMIGANPSFSSITVDNGANFNSITAINGSIGTLTVSGNTYLSGDTYFVPSDTSAITSRTINSAIVEVVEKGEVTVSATTAGLEPSILKKYVIMQNGQQISPAIDIPKDFLVKSGSVITSGGTKYIDLVLNTKDGGSSTRDEHIYINVADLVTDSSHTSTGGTLTITSGHNQSDGTDWYNYEVAKVANKLTWATGTPSADSTGYNGSAAKSIKIPSDASHIANRSVSWTYGSVTGASDGSYSPSQANNGSFVIPKNLSDLGAEGGVPVGALANLKFTTGTTSVTGSPYNGSAEKTITIPSKISHLTNDLSNLKFTTGTTSVTGSPYNGSAEKTITIPSDASHIANRSVSWTYGSVTGASDGSYSPSQANNVSFVIPKNLSDLGGGVPVGALANLKFTTGTTSVTGSPYDGSAEKTITIPSSIDHLTNWNGTCINLPHNVCVTGTITATEGMFTSSDESLKDDIQFIKGDEISRAKRVQLKSFYYKDDASRRKTYGVIAQDVENLGLEELVHYDENGLRSVDYTGLLLLKIAALEKEIDKLKFKLDEQNN